MAVRKFCSEIQKFYPQILAACAVWIILCEVGVTLSWSSPYIVQLTGMDSPIPMSLSQASWVASYLNIGRFIGAVSGSICVNFFGSRKTCLITIIPIAVGWIIILLADSVLELYIARTVLGLGYGFVASCFTLYIGEVSAPEIRASLVSFAVMGSRFGNVIAGFTGTRMSLFTSSITYLVPCIIVIVLLCFLPDSPHHLVKVGNLDAAKKSFQWYNPTAKNIEEELKEIIKFVKPTDATNFRKNLDELRMRHVQKALVLVMILFIFMQMCGLNSILFYMEMIIRKSESTIIEPSSAVTYILVSAVIAAIATMGLYEKFGRKILWIVSSVGVSISLTALGTHFVLLNNKIDWFGAQYLPVVSLFFSIIFYTIGLNSIPSIVSSEIYPTNIKSIALCFANLTSAVTGFISSKSYQPMVDMFGEACAFYIQAFITLLAVPYSLFFMPETKGKTLQQIQNDLLRKK